MDGVCKLCGKHKKLCLSHILPKSFTRRMRSGAPQVVAVTVDDKPLARKSNGEHVEYLLCEKCEELLKKNYEDYGTRLFVDKQNIIEYKSHVLITNFDYQRYFLFIISILWRASISSLNIYKPIQPLAALSALIKPCIFDNTLFTHPPHEFKLDDFIKITMLKIIDHTGRTPQSALDHMIIGLNFELSNSGDGDIHYYFMVDGYLIFVSIFPPNSSRLLSWYPKGRVLNRHTLKIPKTSFYELKQIHEAISALILSAKIHDRPSDM